MRSLVVGGLALVLVVPAGLVIHKEWVVRSGTPVLLELAPVDPRSLIQGDYMRLDYVIERQLADSQRRWPRSGEIVVVVDSSRVARFARRHVGEPLASGEQLLPYRRRHGRLRVSTDAFYFQEGDEPVYRGARYGELRVGPKGTTVLVGLRDSAGAVLGTPMYR